jgi:hypothetical protein
MTSSLRWPLTKSTIGISRSAANRRTGEPANRRTGGPADRGDEPVRDRTERRGRSDPQAHLALKVADDPLGELQLGHVDVQVHPVDALDLEPDVTRQDIGDSAR